MPDRKPQYPPLPPDDPKRNLKLANADRDQTLSHIGFGRRHLHNYSKRERYHRPLLCD